MATYSRKKFLRQSLLLGSFLIINPFSKLFAKDNFTTIPSWEDLVEIARWCPTVHNLQPHKLKIISETEAELYYDPKRLLPVGDPDSIFVTIAMGIFVEHLSIVAQASNATVEIIKFFEPITTQAKEVTKFAVLRIIPSNISKEFETHLIKKRKTSRLHYNHKPVSSELLSKISEKSNQYGHQFYSTSDKSKINFIIKLNRETLFEDLNSEINRTELNTLFRYTQQEAADKKDGLWSECMNFSGSLMRSVFTNYKRWGRGIRKFLIAKFYESSFNGTESIGWFSGDFATTKDWMNAGKIFTHCWLLATKEEAYIQPFGSLITNKNAYKKINETFKQSDDQKIWMIFRIGYSKEPARSYRLNTSDIFI